jgi:nucleotide-binding universal stress UspA family protein
MFGKILLPVDLTDHHDRAMRIATELMRPDGEIVFLHVVEEIVGIPREEEADFYDRLVEKAHAHLRAMETKLPSLPTPVRREVIVGHRPTEVARYAEREGMDLIVLSCPRPDPANPAAGWGSLSHRIGLISPCPVLLVK